MKLSKSAWPSVRSIVRGIVQDPFMQGIIAGTLSWDRFSYYLEQDRYYLQVYKSCLHSIALSAPPCHQTHLMRYAISTVNKEEEQVYSYYDGHRDLVKSGFLSPATLAYTCSLTDVCLQEPVEVAIAAVLPCFWVYQYLGQKASRESMVGNPYAKWIQAYADDEFAENTYAMIEIFDALALNADVITRQKMLAQFQASSVLERRFFHDAYEKVVFDGSLAALEVEQFKTPPTAVRSDCKPFS